MKAYAISRSIYSYDGEYNELEEQFVAAENATEAFLKVFGSEDEEGQSPKWSGPLYKGDFDQRERPVIGEQVGAHDDEGNWLAQDDIEGIPIYWDECQSEGYLIVRQVEEMEASRLLTKHEKIVDVLRLAI